MPQDDSRDSERLRLDRRAAMKAALGGVAAAAVWQAPRIEGLSIAPDVAQAATCIGGNATATHNSTSNIGFVCWGNAPLGGCGSFTMNLPTIDGRFNASVTVGGGEGIILILPDNQNGFANVTVGGIDPPYEACTVTLNGTCNTATTGFPKVRTFVANATDVGLVATPPSGGRCNESDPTCRFACTGDGGPVSITANVACVCGDTAIPAPVTETVPTVPETTSTIPEETTTTAPP